MKFFVAVLFVAVACFGASAFGAALNDAAKPTQAEKQAVADAANAAEAQRFRKSAYGGGSSGGYGSAPAAIPAPPCPKNYLFSCQPSLVPVPCAAPQASYQGAYSAPVPILVRPVQHPLY